MDRRGRQTRPLYRRRSSSPARTASTAADATDRRTDGHTTVALLLMAGVTCRRYLVLSPLSLQCSDQLAACHQQAAERQRDPEHDPDHVVDATRQHAAERRRRNHVDTQKHCVTIRSGQKPSLWSATQRYLYDDTFRCFKRTSTSERHADGQTTHSHSTPCSNRCRKT